MLYNHYLQFKKRRSENMTVLRYITDIYHWRMEIKYFIKIYLIYHVKKTD